MPTYIINHIYIYRFIISTSTNIYIYIKHNVHIDRGIDIAYELGIARNQ